MPYTSINIVIQYTVYLILPALLLFPKMRYAALWDHVRNNSLISWYILWNLSLFFLMWTKMYLYQEP